MTCSCKLKTSTGFPRELAITLYALHRVTQRSTVPVDETELYLGVLPTTSPVAVVAAGNWSAEQAEAESEADPGPDQVWVLYGSVRFEATSGTCLRTADQRLARPLATDCAPALPPPPRLPTQAPAVSAVSARIEAWAAARRAMGTRKGEQET